MGIIIRQFFEKYKGRMRVVRAGARTGAQERRDIGA